ncbi:hypothetical protein C7451_11478 [Blastomonas natatoria]|uniref:SIR2-like protein n=1 Tax=Blastomonas natatoria TaxID=34015 RepID=A0A2V3URS8_9SPHN|nr:hypothetical protein [Blastomonas natatoria]PXW70102.1 hypothetical protein C7451_11478 [Blastomonas natatoria]
MFSSNTVFVVGAGASKEAGFPVGSELTLKIADLVNIHADYWRLSRGDPYIFEAMRTLTQSDPQWEKNQFLGSGRSIAEAMDMAVSIDTFLESHASNPEYVLIGKLGIVRAIAMAERASKMAQSREGAQPFRIRDLAGTWYTSLVQQLFTTVPVERPQDAFDGVSFVVFNYDRCLQTFLVRALEVYFRISNQDAQSIIRKVPIVHAYGTIGSPFSGEQGYVKFGDESVDLISASHRIKTFSESVDSETGETIKQLVEKADTLVFLGFGFHNQNMELLSPDNRLGIQGGKQYRVFATTYGLSESDAQFARDQITLMLNHTGGYREAEPRIFMKDGTCSELFQAYWRSLTA